MAHINFKLGEQSLSFLADGYRYIGSTESSIVLRHSNGSVVRIEQIGDTVTIYRNGRPRKTVALTTPKRNKPEAVSD